MNQVPIGVIGELYIGGVHVGNGYVNNPEQTKESFKENHLDGGVMYKTGDLCRFLSDGNIVYEGRDDFQVKIRGIR